MSGGAVGRRIRRAAAAALTLLLPAAPVHAQALLVPMDEQQADHLRAYGLVYATIAGGEEAEWLLNYRAGSFLLPDDAPTARRAALLGVTVEKLDGDRLLEIRGVIAASNMESVPLEKAPTIAVYTPPNALPWDDAVTLALEYAGIPYEKVWDAEVLAGELSRFDWLHLHHEDFTGQHSKFSLTYAAAPWLQEDVRRNEETARALGFADVPALKRAVALRIREYVMEGGLLFAMCTATETLDLALATPADGGTSEPGRSGKGMRWDMALAFEDAILVTDPRLSAFSDIDGHQVNTPWRRPLGSFSLFDFSAKIDPVPAMLTQSHERVMPDFYGITTSFNPSRLKPGVVVLGREGGGGPVKYLHGSLGRGSFTFLGGHDPEDPRHLIGDPPTDLERHRNSAGYRLILNNVLYPAARRKARKT